MIYPQNLISVYHSEPLVSYSQKLQVPMSKLGTWLLNEDGFPDPTLLKPLSQLPNNDFFNPTLTQQWSGSLENCLKQVCDFLHNYVKTILLHRWTIVILKHYPELQLI